MRPARERGLTLIELLVGFTLLGLLGGLLADGFTLGHRVWERAAARGGARLDAVEGAQAFLRERLLTLYPAWTVVGEARVTVEGEPFRLSFDAAPHDTLGPGTYRRYQLAQGGDGALEVAWRPDTDRSPIARGERAVLLPGVAGIELGYFGPTDRDAVPRWRSEWREQPRPPTAIRLRVRFPPGDPRLWPDLVVAPRAIVDAECVFDPVRRRCRGRD